VDNRAESVDNDGSLWTVPTPGRRLGGPVRGRNPAILPVAPTFERTVHDPSTGRPRVTVGPSTDAGRSSTSRPRTVMRGRPRRPHHDDGDDGM